MMSLRWLAMGPLVMSSGLSSQDGLDALLDER